MPRLTRPVITGLLSLALLTPAAPAWAHDELIGTEPADGAVLTTSPTELRLTFSAELLDVGSTVVLTSAGTPATLPVTVDGVEVTATVPESLAPGEHTVAWRVVSGDGHPIQGTFAFTVGPGTDSPSPTDPPTAADPSPGATASATSAVSPSPALDPGPGRSVLPVLTAVGAAGLLTLVTFLVLRRRASRRSPR